MRILEINGGVYGSTGKIMFSIAELARSEGIEVMCASPVTQKRQLKDESIKYYSIGSYLSRKINAGLDYAFGTQDAFAYFETKKLIKKINAFDPDIIHIHTLHGSYINLKLFFKFLYAFSGQIVWTFHDCWPFTGHCPHFLAQGCEKWRTECSKCPLYKKYPSSLVDRSKKNFYQKKYLINKLNNLMVVTPSIWLKNLVNDSFIKCNEVLTIKNGIKTSIFFSHYSDYLRNKYSIHKSKKIVLAVSFVWNFTKGLDYLLQIDKKLNNLNRKLVVVGVTEKQKSLFSDNVILISRITNQEELSDIYASSDVMVNPTREDNYPTIDLECISCGTPVVCFNSGGTAETVPLGCGYSVETGNVDEMVGKVEKILNNLAKYKNNCKAKAINFSDKNCLSQYIDLYKRVGVVKK